MKTNAARALDKLGIAYEVREYPVDPDDLSAEKVAQGVGLPISQVFKTLVVRGDRRGVLLAVLAGDAELDLKALARLSGDRRVEMVPLKEVQPLTGYIRGGVTALACKKDYPVFADEQIQLRERIAVSAGMRGAQLVLAPADYLRATQATVGSFARDESAAGKNP
jgi:Cys-tRNA(Pro)/Cys-tRNA(Cys) deacylase